MKTFFILVLFLLLIGCAAEKSEKLTEIKGVEKMDLSNKKVLMVLAPEKFRDEEYFIPRQVLEGYGIKVFTTSNKKEAVSIIEQKKVTVDVLLEDATTDYDAIIFVGGPGAAGYFNDQIALDLVKDFYEENKVVAAICIAPTILANAGVLKGKKATVWPSESKNLKAKGATYTSQPVTQDGRIITANGPDAAKDFAETIVQALK
jgi:protease I